jgi:hypothetical protein
MTQPANTNRNEFSLTEKWLVGIAITFGVVGLLIFISSFFYFNHGEIFDKTKKINSSKFGDFGSFISGAVGALWTLVSVILFYITLRLQRKELALQRDELELTRNELQGQKNQMVLQNQTLRHQQFENTFFQLLNIHTSIVNSLDLRKAEEKSSVISEGRDCFNIFYTRLEHYIKTKGKRLTIDPKKSDITDTIDSYYIFYEKNQNNLGHYFRNLYHIIKFVDNSEIEKKKTFTNFVRAQLSSHELALLFYNCLSENGEEKFKPLLEKYALLKNMNRELIFNITHLNEYGKEAYGD